MQNAKCKMQNVFNNQFEFFSIFDFAVITDFAVNKDHETIRKIIRKTTHSFYILQFNIYVLHFASCILF